VESPAKRLEGYWCRQDVRYQKDSGRSGTHGIPGVWRSIERPDRLRRSDLTPRKSDHHWLKPQLRSSRMVAISSHKRWSELSQPEKLSRWLAHQVSGSTHRISNFSCQST